MQKRQAIASLSAILKSTVLFVAVACVASAAWAQSDDEGVVTGTITAADTGATVGDAFVSVPGTEATAVSNADGTFRIVVPAGTHDLIVEKSGFGPELVPEVQVEAGATVTANASLKGQIEQVLVFGRGFIEGSEASALAIQQESESSLEVVGSEEFTRLGDNTAADTLQRVTGLNVQQGKFVVIRGQPARYSSTLLNGSRMPSLDPIQTITPLDLFPSGVLSNVSVQKAFTANRQGSFGAGQVQLSTSGLPAEDFLEFKLGSGVNFESIDSEPLEFNTGNDILGEVDEDLFDLNPELADVLASRTQLFTLPQEKRIAFAQSFSNELAPGFADEGPDVSMAVNGGKRFDRENVTFGASFAYSYRQNIRTQDETRKQVVIDDPTQGTLRVDEDFEIDRTRLTTSQNGFVALSAETDNHALNFNFLWVRDSVERTEVRDGVDENNDEFQRRFLLEFQQREMFIKQMHGEHNLFDIANVQWRGMQANAARDLPDRRTYRLQNTELDGSGLFFFDAQSALQRRFNVVSEDTESGGIDVQFPISDLWFPDSFMTLSLEGGVDSETRERDSDTNGFQFRVVGGSVDRFQPAEQIFSPANLRRDITSGDIVFETFGDEDYLSDFVIEGSYIQTDITLFERLRLVSGIRFEQADFSVDTFEVNGPIVNTVSSGFIRRDDLPSFIGSFSVTDSMQIRAGAARSMSYPSPIEISATTFIDPDSDQRFDGNPELEPVVIDSYDLRWEWYPTAYEALTVGVFYKDMEDPIERSFTNVGGGASQGGVVTFVNALSGEVIGVEVNGRVGLDRVRTLFDKPQWLPPFVDDMHFAANFTYQDSEVKLDPDALVSGTAVTNLIRRMTGQPEILANVQIGYTGSKHVISIAAGYQSDRLINAGINGIPDEFIEPRISLGGKWSYTVIDPLTISLRLQNLVDDAFQRRRGNILTRDFNTGVTGSLSVKYRFD